MSIFKKKPDRMRFQREIEIELDGETTVFATCRRLEAAVSTLSDEGFTSCYVSMEPDGEYAEDGSHLAVVGWRMETDEEYNARCERYAAAAKRREETKAKNKEAREAEKKRREGLRVENERRCSTSAYFSTGCKTEARSFRCYLETGHLGDHRYSED